MVPTRLFCVVQSVSSRGQWLIFLHRPLGLSLLNYHTDTRRFNLQRSHTTPAVNSTMFVARSIS